MFRNLAHALDGYSLPDGSALAGSATAGVGAEGVFSGSGALVGSETGFASSFGAAGVSAAGTGAAIWEIHQRSNKDKY